MTYCPSCGGVGTVGQGSVCPACHGSSHAPIGARSRDATIREVAQRISVLAAGTPFDLAFCGVLLFISAQTDIVDKPEVRAYVSKSLREMADAMTMMSD